MTFATIGFGSYLVVAGSLSIGEVIVVVNLVQGAAWPMTEFIEGLNGMRAAKGVYDKAREKACATEATETLADFNNGINIEGLGLKYEEDTYVLKNLNLDFTKGRKYAVLAPSGYGKTSLARALALEFLEYEGTIKIDGKEIKYVNPNNYYQFIRYVRQDPYLFTDTAINNITFFGERPPQEELDRILRVTRVDEFMRNEEDLQREVSNNSGLSGGQKQRIVLARALLHKPNILVLDEITSGVDLETACDILKDIFEDRELTVIAITHESDESFLGLFDEIVQLDEVA